nr:cell division control protein 48 homolog C-like isoform X4 [Ziziphus jujuba var. spinosa]
MVEESPASAGITLNLLESNICEEAAHSKDSSWSMDGSTVLKVKTMHISSPILAAKVHFFIRRSQMAGEEAGYTLVIGATNRPEVLDPALRRAGRFETEILLGVPDENARANILSRKLPSLVSFDVKRIARSTPGFVPADLNALITRANSIALERL